MLPYDSELDGDLTDCALWKAENPDDHITCEYNSDRDIPNVGLCDNSGYFYGTSDSREPKFCARHFYQHVVSGDGKSNYKLSK